MNQRYRFISYLTLIVFIFGSTETSIAANNKKFNVVIHISKNQKSSFTAAINQAQIIRNHYGKEKVNIEVLVNGTGVGFVNKQNVYVTSIKELINNGVRFTACNASVKRMLKTQNIETPLIDGVKFVPFGVVRLIDLQRQGYYYLKP